MLPLARSTDQTFSVAEVSIGFLSQSVSFEMPPANLAFGLEYLAQDHLQTCW